MDYPGQPNDYTIVHFEAGDFKDNFGNTWCNVLFEGFTGEQIRWVVKDVSKYKVGDTVYGHFETKMSKANKPYIRFYTDKKEDYGDKPQPAKYAPKDDHTQESIARSVALKASVDFVGGTSVDVPIRRVTEIADVFLAWLQGSSESTSPKAESPSPQAHSTTTRDERDEYNDMRSLAENEPYPEDYPG